MVTLRFLWTAGASILVVTMGSISSTVHAQRIKIVINGSPESDTLTVNDAAGVVCASKGVRVEGAGKSTALARVDRACPGSVASHQQWRVASADGDIWYTGNFGAGDDRYTRIDGPGNDRYEYNAGEGNDIITSSDGPGDDQYLYNNGAGNDFSAHDNYSPGASGNDVYIINGGPGTDRTEVFRDGPGDDTYRFFGAESMSFSDFSFGDKDIVERYSDDVKPDSINRLKPDTLSR
jgi:hypothetical protein